MKKTLITLMALAGVAAAETEQDTYSAAVTRTGTDVSATFAADSPINAITFQNVTITPPQGTAAPTNTFLDTTSETHPGTLTPNVNVGTGGSWTVDMLVTPGTYESPTIHVASITLGVFTFNSGGNKQNADTYVRDINFTLLDGNAELDNQTISFTQSVTYGSDWEQTYTLTFDTPIVLTTRNVKKFTLGVSKDNSEGTYVGVYNVAYKLYTVPEPTTATLSLLALAGLAARRRRK